MRTRHIVFIALVFLGWQPRETAAQVDTIVVGRLGAIPSSIYQAEQWAVDFFNHPSTTRVVGRLNIGRDARYTSDLAVLNGPLIVAGVIEGDLVAINSDLEIRSGAVIHGSVLVFGGRFRDEEGAAVRGSIRQYSDRVDVRLEGDRLRLVRTRYVPEVRRRAYYRSRGQINLRAGLGGTYNRVEGLPVRLGADLNWRSGYVQTLIRGYGIFRTAGDYDDTDREDIGYNVDASIRYDRGSQALTVGGRLFDVVTPTQAWPLELNEVGWSSLLWHQDYRDYFLQRGYSGFVTLEPTHHISLTGQVARLEETSIAARDPWTLKLWSQWRHDEPWRPNIVVDEGDFTVVSASGKYDSRPSRRSRGTGLMLEFGWERGFGENMVEYPLPASVRQPLPPEGYTWDLARIDVRLYQRIDWGGQLRLRGFWAGTVGEDPLPVQRRYSLGGPDPMNGFEFRKYACNVGVPDASMPGLCDHVLFFQAEYRGHIGFGLFDDGLWSRRDARREPNDIWDWDWDDWFWFDGPTIVLFSDAGTAWLEGEDMPSLGVDVGVGIELGSAGLYAALPVTEGGPVRWTLRIERRF